MAEGLLRGRRGQGSNEELVPVGLGEHLYGFALLL